MIDKKRKIIDVAATIFPGDHCGCGGKIMRHLQERMSNQDDQGGCFCCVQMIDVCEKCEKLHDASPEAVGPIEELRQIFAGWQTEIMERSDLDTKIDQAITGRKLCRDKQG